MLIFISYLQFEISQSVKKPKMEHQQSWDTPIADLMQMQFRKVQYLLSITMQTISVPDIISCMHSESEYLLVAMRMYNEYLESNDATQWYTFIGRLLH